jgi:hypothetical protein
MDEETQIRFAELQIPVLMKHTGELVAIVERLFGERIQYDPDNPADVMLLSFVRKQHDHLRSIRVLVSAGGGTAAGVFLRLFIRGQRACSCALDAAARQ